MEEQIEKKEIENSGDCRLSVFDRCAIFFVGVLFPPVAFRSAVFFVADWQENAFESYVGFLLTPKMTCVFWPLVAFSMACLIAVLINRSTSRFMVIRAGLYMGALWSFQYILLLAMALPGIQNELFGYHSSNIFKSLLVINFGIFVTLSAFYTLSLLKKVSSQTTWYVRLFIYVLAVACNYVIVVILSIPFLAVVMFAADAVTLFVIIAPLAAAPFWCFSAYLYMSVNAFRDHRMKHSNIILKSCLALVNFSYYAMAWVLSFSLVQKAYLALPKEKPQNDCYIATAAARGHRGFVGSEDVMLAGGEVMRVNDQLRRLKCGEHILKAAFPWLHRLFRLIYNAIGPHLANCLVHPVLADITYVMLKPAEWCVCGVLFILYGKKCNVPEKFYDGVKKTKA
jgi:hypothetical protein